MTLPSINDFNSKYKAMDIHQCQTTNITALGYLLLVSIHNARATGITRPQLAAQLHKKHLNVWHETQLQLLEDEGLIVVNMFPNGHLVHIDEFIYLSVLPEDVQIDADGFRL